MLRRLAVLLLHLLTVACGQRAIGARETRPHESTDAALDVARTLFPDAFGGPRIELGVSLYIPLTVCEELPDVCALPIVADETVREHIFEFVVCREGLLVPLVSFLVRDRASGVIYAIPAGTHVGFDRGDTFDPDDPEYQDVVSYLYPERLVEISARGTVTDGSASIRIFSDARAGIVFDDARARGDASETMLRLLVE